MQVGKRLRELRQARKLSQQELGRALGMTHAAVSKLETGKARIDADLLPRIAEVLDVPVSAFFEERRPTVEPAVEELVRRTAELAAEREAAEVIQGVERVAERVAERERAIVREQVVAAMTDPVVLGRLRQEIREAVRHALGRAAEATQERPPEVLPQPHGEGEEQRRPSLAEVWARERVRWWQELPEPKQKRILEILEEPEGEPEREE